MIEPKKCLVCSEILKNSEVDWYPCPCGYQICSYCFDRCKPICPSCRQEFPSNAFQRVGEKFSKIETSVQINEFISVRSLLRVLNLPPELLKESLLISPSFFGVYGKVENIVICSPDQAPYEIINFPPSDKPFVILKYSSENEASTCISCLNDRIIRGFRITVHLILNEQCKKYLAEVKCDDKKCLKIHRNLNPASDFIIGRNEVEAKSSRYLNEIVNKKYTYSNFSPRNCLVISCFPPPTIQSEDNSRFHNWILRERNDVSLDFLFHSNSLLPPPHSTKIQLPNLVESLSLISI